MALKRYHVNPENGIPGLCVAKRRCRYGGDAVHYPSEIDARMGYERSMERAAARKDQRSPKGTVTRLPDGMVGAAQFDLQPGTYLLSDPYLTLGLKDQAGWNDVVASIGEQFGWEHDINDPTKQSQVAVGAMYDNEPVLALKSFHGEGLHWSLGPTRRVPSETGLIGFVSKASLESLGIDVDQAEKRKLGMRVDVGRETTVWRDPNGIIVVGGRLLICHNDLIQSQWFGSLDKADGVNNAVATNETYAFLTERAQLWLKDPALASR